MSKQTFAGKTVEKATDLALDTLGVKLEDVEISVVNPGRSGILGFGGEAAEIEVRLLSGESAIAGDDDYDDAGAEAEEDDPQPGQDRDRPQRARGGRRRGRRQEQREQQEEGGQRGQRGRRDERGPRAHRGPREERGQREQRGQREERGRREQREQTEERQPVMDTADEEIRPVMVADDVGQSALMHADEASVNEQPPEEYDEEAEQAVANLLDYFFETMGVNAETYVREEREGGSLVFEIEGSDAGLLIGRRGETLHALQFLVRMIVGRQIGRKAYIVLDVEDYRERRSDMLQSLARRTAGRVASSGGSSSLEPMSPAERRVVHMALADHPGVRTESEGKGDRRRVVILPQD